MDHSLQLDVYDRNMSYAPRSRSSSVISRLVDPNRVLIWFVRDAFSSVGLNVSEAAVAASELLVFILLVYTFMGLNIFDQSPVWLLSLPMLLVYWLVFIVAVDFAFSNVPSLERFLNPELKAEALIQDIKDGEITPEEARTRIMTNSFSGENLNHLIIGLSREGLLIPSLQDAIVSSQKMYFRNLEVLFCGASDINLGPSAVSKILKNEPNSLKEVEILSVYKKNPRDFGVLSTLLSTQPAAYRILKQCVDDTDIIEVIYRYLEKNKMLRMIAYADRVQMICGSMAFLFVVSLVTGFIFYDLFLSCLFVILASPVIAKLVMAYAEKRLSAGLRKVEDFMGD
jgi:hypothetical protein